MIRTCISRLTINFYMTTIIFTRYKKFAEFYKRYEYLKCPALIKCHSKFFGQLRIDFFFDENTETCIAFQGLTDRNEEFLSNDEREN